MVVVGQINELAACKRNRGRKPRTLGADRILGDLHHQAHALAENLFDGLHDAVGAVRAFDVHHMEKPGALKSDVDKGGLHARQHPDHFPLIDVTHKPAALRALNMHVFKDIVDDHGFPAACS